jgi:hypothetical protein
MHRAFHLLLRQLFEGVYGNLEMYTGRKACLGHPLRRDMVKRVCLFEVHLTKPPLAQTVRRQVLGTIHE